MMEPDMLNDRTALVVEEEFLIALDIQRMLESLGVARTLFALTASEAQDLRPHWSEVAIAIVDIRTHDADAAKLVEDLRQAGVPTLLTTADTIIASAGFFADLPVLAKPTPEDAMTSAVLQALATRA